MDTTIQIPKDFIEFIRLLNEHEVRYLLVGGYAVGIYGYPRPTADMDIWISNSPENAGRVVAALKRFGFTSPDFSPALFEGEKNIVQMGVAPLKLEIITFIDGVGFDECYLEKEVKEIGGLSVSIISLNHLKVNKKASGRLKDLNDLENLP